MITIDAVFIFQPHSYLVPSLCVGKCPATNTCATLINI